jgi:hypothetical protein
MSGNKVWLVWRDTQVEYYETLVLEGVFASEPGARARAEELCEEERERRRKLSASWSRSEADRFIARAVETVRVEDVDLRP